MKLKAVKGLHKQMLRVFLDEVEIDCYWVGPPRGPDYVDEATYELFNSYIQEVAEANQCIYVDSSPYTEFAFCSNGDTFGCPSENAHFTAHYGGSVAAEAWADSVYNEIVS